MPLRFHNTLTRSLDTFSPTLPDRVTLYTCGPTVYDYLHVGNWAAYIYWDILVRTLKVNGLTVERVMNITDVGHLVSDEDDGEDKLQKGAKREGKTAWDVAKLYSEDFLAGMDQLSLVSPEHITHATEYINEQLELVRILKQKGFTYQIDDGIYFDTSKFPTYAEFAGLNLAAQRAGARVNFNDEKRHPSDFALWKFSPENEQRDMEWDTPTDLLDEEESKKGFPGWHLECSAMAMTKLGNTIDIHTGGIDHIPVHHTNEIAQSEAATGQLFSRFWLHNNHMKSNGTKISKSLGNGYTLHDLKDRGYEPAEYKLFVLQGHYRSEGNFTFEGLDAAKNRYRHWRSIAALRHQTHDTLLSDDEKNDSDNTVTLLASSRALIETLSDDLDTPDALAIIDEAFTKIESLPPQAIHRFGLQQFLETIEEALGISILQSTPDISDHQKRLVLERQTAREQRDWRRSDELRDELLKDGIAIRDTAHGPIWHYA